MSVEPQSNPREPLAKKAALALLAPGARVGAYVIERPLGAGGMGQVYLALDEGLGRRVALKILPPEHADDEARARFLREARALARCEHPNVVRVFASGADGETAWMALEVVDGDSLSDLGAGQPVDEETVLGLMAQVARGLAAVHAVGVVHRDVKPENLLVDGDAVVKIVDFGVALLADPGSGGFTTRKGIVVGTPHFMSPEQARGGNVDARSDAWSFGATLFALLTGRPPFYGSANEADLDILTRVLRDPVPDVKITAPSTSPATVNLLQQLLKRDPDQRRHEMAAVADVMDEITAALALGERVAPSSVLPLANTLGAVDADNAAAVAAGVPSLAAARPGVVVALMLLLVVVAVVGGVGLGKHFIEPEIRERIVERMIEVPVAATVAVPVDVPVAVPVAVPVEVPAPISSSYVLALPANAPPAVWAEAVIQARPSEVSDFLEILLKRPDDNARAALLLVAASLSPAGELLLTRVEEEFKPLAHDVWTAALFSPSKERALQMVSLLASRRDDVALSLLQSAAATHKHPAVRRAAAVHRDSIFKVEE